MVEAEADQQQVAAVVSNDHVLLRAMLQLQVSALATHKLPVISSPYAVSA